MKILILAEGMRGDMQPCLALAQAVEKAGHDAAVIGLTRWPSPYISESGVSFTAVGRDSAAKSMETVAPRLTLGGIRGTLARAELARQVRPVLAAALDEVWAAARDGADLVAYVPGILAGQQVAERLGVPAAVVTLNPLFVPPADTAGPMSPGRVPVLSVVNWVSYAFFTLPRRGPTRAWRERTLRLPPRRGENNPWRRPDGVLAPVLAAYSRHAVPASPDARRLQVTGFWLCGVPAGWQPPPALVEFIERGDPPVYVGFGSMYMADPGKTWRIVLHALELARVRAVIAIGWSGGDVAQAGKNVYVADQVPHGWLFPRVAAVVHHGGAGTIGAALAAGRPQVICPWFYDQPFWADRMRQLGVAGTAAPLRRHTPATLAAAIREAVSDDGMRKRAEILSQAVRAENGAETAVKILEKIHREGRP
jgi:sterol 3beta-glucosyltransferase